MKNNRAKYLLISLLIFSCVLFAIYMTRNDAERHGGDTRGPAEKAGSGSQYIGVEVFEVKPGEVTGEQLVPAVLMVESTAGLTAQRDGVLVWLCCQEGAAVVKDQIIARLSDDESRANFHQAELELRRMKIEGQQSEALVKLNVSDLERQSMLFKSGLISRRDLDQAQYKLLTAKQDLEKIRFGIQIAQARLEAANADMGKSDIRAPFAGIITYRNGSIGASVARGEKLFEISEAAPLGVKFQMPHTERKQLEIGGLVDIALADGDQVIAQARVQRVDPVVDSSTNSLGYFADVLGGAGLIPGMAVYVRIPRHPAGETLYIPRAAFAADAALYQGASTEVLILDGNKCFSRAVLVNSLEGDQVEIRSGLAIGDRVILAPPVELKPGDLVEPKTS
ncbi:MAG TPA: efflux RND transporter periplasmic adaptor subunit [Blastocatellia bacterium]|nr:efflux RND transporter periplasmic adaptor subunit [Blastocatellia bacterium]